VREGQWQDRRVVMAHDPNRAKEQSERRQQKLTELTELGERLAAKLDAQDEGKSERGRRASDRGAYTRFSRAVYEAHLSRIITPLLDSERFSFAINESALKDAERLDGKLILVTNVSDFAPEDILSRYQALADIERGFRVLKRDLEIAPVFHRKSERLQAHAFICFFALLLHRVLRRQLKAKSSPYSVERVINRLRAIQLHQVSFGERAYRGLTKMTPEQLKLFETLEVPKPTVDALR
jgi:transposase